MLEILLSVIKYAVLPLVYILYKDTNKKHDKSEQNQKEMQAKLETKIEEERKERKDELEKLEKELKSELRSSEKELDTRIDKVEKKTASLMTKEDVAQVVQYAILEIRGDLKSFGKDIKNVETLLDKLDKDIHQFKNKKSAEEGVMLQVLGYLEKHDHLTKQK